ncbi:OPT oligopeptide transporter protein-domain-containing protein [Schizophyllum commune]
MAAFDAPILEKTQPPVVPAHSDSFLSESEKDKDSGIGKDSEKDKEAGHVQPPVEVATDDVGEVFDDVRVIDLDENGKERPIESARDYATRLLSLEDDPSLPIFTIRTVVLGIGFAAFASVLGQLFYFRPQSISVSQLFLQIFAFILGKAMEEVIPGTNPNSRFPLRDSWWARFLNPGPFNIKEHVAITIMGATSSDSALAISIFAAQDLYYNVKPNAATAIFTLIGSQLIGYGLAGMMRVFLVWPTFAVYPHIIPTVQLFDVLHRGQKFFLQKKRVRFFWGTLVAIFVWEWFPEYIAPTLTGVSIFCLANQDSPWFSRIFGGATGNEGLGMFSLCFDWNYVGAGGGAIGSLFTPLSTQMSMYAGTAVCIIAFCAVYAQNVWKSQNFPFLSQLLFYENGTEYNQLLILNDDFTLNSTKLAEQGLPYYAGSQVLFKVSRTMYIGAAIMHFVVWHSKDVWKLLKHTKASLLNSEEIDDPHYQKMQVYKECPLWWYAALFVASFAMAIATSYTAHSGLPWWALIVSLLVAAFLLPIIGTLYCTVGYAPSIEILIEMIGAAMVPGKPVANMYATLYGYNSVTQATSLLRDLKMGQYTKLPPRVTFTCQVLGSIIGGVLNFVVANNVLTANREVLLDVQGSNVWSGQNIQSYNTGMQRFSAAVQRAIAWGALGKDLYKPGTQYGFIPWMILVGLVWPIPFWLAHSRWPKFGFDKVFTPILTAELGILSVGINSGIFMSFLLAVFSQYYLRKYRARWFRKYNFLLSAALDGGTQIMVFVYSFAVGGASGSATPFPTWALNPAGNPDYCKRLT